MRSGGWNHSFESAKIAARSLIFSGKQRFQMPVATTRKRNNMCYSGAGRGNVRSVVSSSDKPCVVTALLELCQMFPGCSWAIPTFLASDSRSFAKACEYLLKMWQMSPAGLLHREMNSSLSSPIHLWQTSLPPGDLFIFPPSFHSPFANPFLFLSV